MCSFSEALAEFQYKSRMRSYLRYDLYGALHPAKEFSLPPMYATVGSLATSLAISAMDAPIVVP